MCLCAAMCPCVCVYIVSVWLSVLMAMCLRVRAFGASDRGRRLRLPTGANLVQEQGLVLRVIVIDSDSTSQFACLSLLHSTFRANLLISSSIDMDVVAFFACKKVSFCSSVSTERVARMSRCFWKSASRKSFPVRRGLNVAPLFRC